MQKYESIYFKFPANQLASRFIEVPSDLNIGNIIITTDANFDGTTSSIKLYGSNDNLIYAPVYQDNNSDLMEITLATNQQYTWYFRKFIFKFYRVDYTPGDATLGTYTANFLGKRDV